MYLFNICHADTDHVIRTINALNAHDAYDAFVAMDFGNGTCGFDVDVVSPDGCVVEF